MSRNLTSADRQRIIDNAWATLEYLRKPPHMVHSVRASIDLEIDDGLGAANYDGDGIRSADHPSPQERAVMRKRADTACDDLAALDRALRQLADADRELDRLIRRYPINDPSVRRGPPKPGDGHPPDGQCVDHWNAGRRRDVKRGRYSHYCRLCGEYRAKHGRPQPPGMIQAEEDYPEGSMTREWRVARAIASAN